MLRFHSDSFFGLAKSDSKMHNCEWRPSNLNKIKRHGVYMRALVQATQETDEIDLDDIDLPDLNATGI